MPYLACAEHSLIIDSNKCVWAFGCNSHGELGVGEIKSKMEPSKIPSLNEIVSVATGDHFSLFLHKDGSVWSCGDNKDGQLGLGSVAAQFLVPTKISNLPKIVAIAAAHLHSLFLDAEGAVWSCGQNSSGQLGLGNNRKIWAPQKIPKMPTVKAIVAGRISSMFLDESGVVWTCGYNSEGELGLGDNTHRSTPEQIKNIPKIVTIFSGWFFSGLIDEEGGLWTFGYNRFGQLGHGDTVNKSSPKRVENLPKIKTITGGNYFSVVLDFRGDLWSCGKNSAGQLGQADAASKTTYQKIKNTVRVTMLASGSDHTIFVDSDGFIWGFGQNNNLQLSLNENVAGFNTPAKLSGVPHMCVIWTDLTDIFNEVKKGQSKHLMEIMQKSGIQQDVKIPGYVKDKLLKGVIPMSRWENIWTPIHEKHLELAEGIENTTDLLEQQLKALKDLQEQCAITQEKLHTLQGEIGTVAFFDEILEVVVQEERQLSESFARKLGTADKFSVEDVSLFLSYCGLNSLVELFQSQQIDGEKLLLLASVSGYTSLGIDDILLVRQLEFYCKLLKNGILFKDNILNNSVIWRHNSTEKTLSLLNEYNILLDKQIIVSKQITIGPLLYFRIEDFVRIFKLPLLEGARIVKSFKAFRKNFKSFVRENKVNQ